MVYRVYVEKRKGLDNEARSLCEELRTLLGIKGLKSVRLLNRYDAENITEDLFNKGIKTIFSEQQLDVTYEHVPKVDGKVFAVEYLPGQFDQRADSAAQCFQILSCGDRPTIKTAKIYLLEGDITDNELQTIKKYVINPVEAREAKLDRFETLALSVTEPERVKTLTGFINYNEEQLKSFLDANGLAMDLDDLKFCQNYFASEKRDPTITEIKVIDTYWSDHCRHTTFLT